MGTRKSIRPVTRGTAALMAVVAMFQIRTAAGAPDDIFMIAAPVVGSDPPKATDIRDGDASVSTQTGALQYSYPIQVPPGPDNKRYLLTKKEKLGHLLDDMD